MATVPQCGIDLIKLFEGYERKQADGSVTAYPDPIVGWDLPTIGWGSTTYPNGSPIRRGDTISRERAEQCLQAELKHKCEAALEKIPTWQQMNDHQQGALYSFAYNLGANFYHRPNFQSISTLCDSPERWSDHVWIESQFIKYCNPGSSVEAGLRRRRSKEAALFCTPVT